MKIDKFFKRKTFLIIILLVGILTTESALLVLPKGSNQTLTSQQLADFANAVLDKCQSSTYKPSCYDEEIPKLMDTPNNLTMEDAFSVTKLVQKDDSKYLYCHVLGHKLSQKETKKDPSKWKDILTRCPTTMCNNGCLHGSMMERFQSENLTEAQIDEIKPDLLDVCEPRNNWHPKEVERSMCYHALGHLHMYITNADILKSVDLCRFVGVKEDGRNYVQTCTQGVFMQIFQPLDPEDIALVKDITPKKQDIETFCNKYQGENRGACFRESWPLFRDEIMKPEGLIKFCSYSDEPIEHKKCYSAAMSMLTVMFMVEHKDIEELKQFCTKLPPPEDGECFGYAAGRLIQIDPIYLDQALEVCNEAGRLGFENNCYTSLVYFGNVSFEKGSPAQQQYCNRLPLTWKDKCLKVN